MNHRKNRTDLNEGFDWMDRLIAALLAPVFFNVAVLITLACILKFDTYLLQRLTDLSAVSTGIGVVFIALPSAIGFLFGTSGFAWFLGHCFYTHDDAQQNPVITALLWATIGLLAYWISRHLTIA